MIEAMAAAQASAGTRPGRPPRRPVVAVVQPMPVLGDVGHNLDATLGHVAALAGQADLVVLPELFATGYSLDLLDLNALAEPVPDGSTSSRLAEMAATGIAVVAGVVERAGDHVFDTVVVLDRTGELVARYRKTHLHPSEEAHFAQGDELVVVELEPGIRLGLAICFEHGFPELFAELALAGANVIAIPSAVPEGFGYLLDLRTRARAQDNQLFVLAANLAGDDGATRWCGGSAIVNPRGEPLAVAPSDREAQLVAEIDLDHVDAERLQEPLFLRRRPELYARLRTRTVPPPTSGGDIEHQPSG